jgi:hypothetical protein
VKRLFRKYKSKGVEDAKEFYLLQSNLFDKADQLRIKITQLKDSVLDQCIPHLKEIGKVLFKVKVSSRNGENENQCFLI